MFSPNIISEIELNQVLNSFNTYGGYLSNRPRKTEENKGKQIKTKGSYFRFSLVFLGFAWFCLFVLGFPRFPCYLGGPRTGLNLSIRPGC